MSQIEEWLRVDLAERDRRIATFRDENERLREERDRVRVELAMLTSRLGMPCTGESTLAMIESLDRFLRKGVTP